MPIYAKAPDALDVLVGKLMEKYHGELHETGVTVDVLFASPTTGDNGESSGPPLKKNGYPVPAVSKVNTLKNRVLGHGDCEICLDDEQWKTFKEDQRAALIDHELAHFIVVKDKDGVTKTDDLDRPRLRIRAHDREVGWFNEVVRRHGRSAFEFGAFNDIWQTCRQLELPFTEIG